MILSLILPAEPNAPLLLPFPLLLAAVTAIGFTIGSFLNVVIHRIPREESIVFPNSRCPECGAAIRPYDNVPVISYLVLRGRCRNCRTHISARYPAVEALTGLLFALTFAHDGLTLALPFDLIFVAVLVALVFIDAEHMILPDVLTLPAFALALIFRALVPHLYGLGFLTDGLMAGWPDWAVSLFGALFGAAVGGGSLWLIGWLWERLRGIEAMGFGDVKMMFMVGALLGWPRTLLTMFLAVIVGSIAGLGVMFWRRERNMQLMLPFGIFLGLGALVCLFAGDQIINWYVGRFQ
ncbi:MAG TPA: prepilin peptidase [Pyrinomonadaceae bacterium]|jgi:leader peptidase (prepilin peptidase)/N-methyltransferase